jgi:hypothetical protein
MNNLIYIYIIKIVLILTFISPKIVVFGQIEGKKNPLAFLPKGYVVFEKLNGDLNKDGTIDCVLIIKGTDKSKFVTEEYRGTIDRNRRGIIALFKNNNQYKLALKNYNCFSSENENGGVYFAPDLTVEIKKGKLYIHYGHGRYGYWKYTFKFLKNTFQLIGYDQSSNKGPMVESKKSINFLTKIKQLKVNTNMNADFQEEIFKTTYKKIKINQLMEFSKIKDFDDLDMSSY